MADPRFKCQIAAAQAQSARQSFTNAISKVGDLNVLNSIGAGAIGQGLRTLVSVSNSIRTGCGALPTSIGSSLDAGANWVLGAVGISSSSVAAVNNINPQAANLAQGQATQIFQKVSAGNYKFSDIPNSLQDLQNLQRLASGIYPATATQTAAPAIQCTTSPYAEDLISHAPKYKFLFVVQFIFNTGYQNLQQYNIAFAIKKTTRPSAKFVMEDVNYYNFRTKVPTKTEFEEMTMSFHDDMQNNALTFYNAYRNALSPITNMNDQMFFTSPEDNGMNFDPSAVLGNLNTTETSTPYSTYTASRGPLINDTTNVIKEIKLYHLYDYGRLVNVYQFLNPRITELSLDELDMAEGTSGTEVSIKFNYDTCYIYDSVKISDSSVSDSAGIVNGQSGGKTAPMYPLRNVDTLAKAIATRAPAPKVPTPANCSSPPSPTSTGTPASAISSIASAASSATGTASSSLLPSGPNPFLPGF